MIYVSQGHEHSIGLEVFLKSWLSLSKSDQLQFTLIASKQSLIETLDSLKLPYSFDEQDLILCYQKLNIINIQDSEYSESLTSLLYILNIIGPSDILLTLPTSKDQLVWNNKTHKGYTEFFRYYYDQKDITMSFKSFDQQVGLITDHIPLNQVSSYITAELIMDKVEHIIKFTQTHMDYIKHFLFAGINPHAGEGGLLGTEDPVINKAINLLEQKYPKYQFTGPISGDALHVQEKSDCFNLYMYHDQGLTRFKAQNGFSGVNISLGLPFLRVSVDHGTAFSLYKKNCADYNGAVYTLNECLNFHRKYQ